MRESTISRASVHGGTMVEAGAFAGMVGGVVMALFLMFATGAHGDLLAPMRLIGLSFEHPNALLTGVGAAVWGFTLQLSLAAVLGIFFASAVGRASAGVSAGAGVVFGLVVCAVLTYLVLPWANPPLSAAVHRMMLAWVSAYVIFGLCLGLAGPLNGRWNSHFEWDDLG
jgi:hypothetical protein